MLPRIKTNSKGRRKKKFFSDLSDISNSTESDSKYPRKMDCCICLQEFMSTDQPNISITKCHHYFCTSCLIKTMKYGNKCPLCRTILRSPTRKMTMSHDISSSVVQEELLFYNDYIKESFNFIIDMVIYYISENKLTENIRENIHQEMKKVFQNFGMGICFNVNRSLEELYSSQYQEELPPVSTIQPLMENINSLNIDLEDELLRVPSSEFNRSMSAPNILSPNGTRLINNDNNNRRDSSPVGFPPI